MDNQKAEDLLSSLLENAKRAGADAADAVLYNAVSHGVSWRMGALEDVERSEGLDLGLRVMVGQRQANVSTTDISKEGLKELASRCAAMAKAAPEDPYCGLGPKDRLAKAPFPDLELGDFLEPSTQQLKERAAKCEEAALAVKGIANSSGANASYSEGAKWFATSDGFFGTSGGAGHSLSVSVLAQDENGMERDYDYDSKTHLADMRSPEEIGAEAAERTIARLSPKKADSQTAAVIFDSRLSASILGHLAGAINGGAIARGVSFLKDKLGEQLFPANITIIDDPFMKRGAGSKPFDGEGLQPEKLEIIKDGFLTNWIMNSAHGRQLGLESNARATRGVGGGPGAGATNMYMPAGAVSVDELIAKAGKGLLLTDMFGPQVNSDTGDYSVGCSGFWIEGGAVSYPVSEITIAGNLLEMFASLVPADNLEFRGAKNAPSILIPEMTIAGN